MLDKNRLYLVDCLNVIPKLIAENIKPDLIYIDPPFGIRQDEKFGMIQWSKNTQPPNRIDEILPVVPTSIGERNYLRYMYPRLALMRELLSEQGSIYVHIDWHVG